MPDIQNKRLGWQQEIADRVYMLMIVSTHYCSYGKCKVTANTLCKGMMLEQLRRIQLTSMMK